MSTDNKPKKPRKAHTCSVCGQAGHTARAWRKCPKSSYNLQKQNEVEFQELRHNTTVIEEKKDTAVLKKCKMTWCRNVVDEKSWSTLFCSQGCEIAFQKQQANSTVNQSTYDEKYANEYFYKYLRDCELSHEAVYIKVEDTLVPRKRPQVPSMAGYATYVGRSKSTLRFWTTKHKEFREAMLMLKQFQEMYLINNGVTGIYNPKVASLLLMNNHGMRERAEKSVNHLFGIVREVYEKADQFDKDASLDDPFDGESNASIEAHKELKGIDTI